MWITKKKYKEKMQEAYDKGFKDSSLFSLDFRQTLYYDKVISSITAELKELEKNTWDKNRVERIRKILITGLS